MRRSTPRDPDRPDRIADAALEVITRRGIHGVSHRAVAAEAGVPLGSTTYHLKTLDGILVAAVGKAIRSDRAVLDAWASGLGDSPDLAAALTDLALRTGDQVWRRRTVAYELYVAALRRPALQPLSREWSALLSRHLERFVDPGTADTLAVTFDGILVRVLVSGQWPPRRRVECLFRRILRS